MLPFSLPSSFWTIGKRRLLRDCIFNLLPTIILLHLFFKKSRIILQNSNYKYGLLSILLASVAIYSISKFLVGTIQFYTRAIRRPKIPPSSYHGKWAIITGASSAVGSAFAVQLATSTEMNMDRNMNMHLCLIGRNEEKLKKLADHIQHISKRRDLQIITISNDFADNSNSNNANAKIFHEELDLQLNKMVAQYRATGKGGIGALIHCMNYRNEIPCIHHDHTLSDVKRMMTTNLSGTVDITEAVLTYLKLQMQGNRNHQHKSVIITVGSHASHHPTPLMSLYSATNAYRNAYGKQYYNPNEYSKYGIEFLSVTPELMSSNMPRKKQNAAFVRSPSADRIVAAALRNVGYQSEYFSWFGHCQTTIIPHVMWIHPWQRFLSKMKVARLEMLQRCEM